MQSVISQRIKYLRRQRSALDRFLLSLEELEEVSTHLFEDIFININAADDDDGFAGEQGGENFGGQSGENAWLISFDRDQTRREAITGELQALEYLLYIDEGYLHETTHK